MSEQPPPSPPSFGDRLRTPGGAILVALAILLVLYSVLIAGQLLLVVWTLVTLGFVWLAYRFVRAHERLAAACERMAAGERGGALRDDGVSGSGDPDDIVEGPNDERG